MLKDERTRDEVLSEGGDLLDDGYLGCAAEEIPREIMHARFLEHHARSRELYSPRHVETETVIALLYGAAKEIRDLHARLEHASERSVRVEKAESNGGEPGCRFVVGPDHVVAEWRGDGVAADTVFVERPALTYFQTTASYDRCIRMVLEMVHWEVVSAMLVGPGNGRLEAVSEIKNDVLGAFGIGEILEREE